MGRLVFACLLLSFGASCSPPAPKIASGFFTTSDGVKLHYLEAGRGPAVVFQPGWTMPAEIWEPQIRHFAQRYRVVALDPRSQGESEKPAEGHYPERRAQDIKELVEQLKLAPAVLVGWSMGVPELLAYVGRFGTSTIRALVLVDGFIGDEPNPKMSAQIWGFVRSMQEDRRKFAGEFVRSMYKKPQPEEYYRKIIAASLKTPTNTAVALFANVFATGDWRPVLAKLDRPVLYVATPQLRSQAAMVKQRLPSARVEIFEDSGHALFVDEPERFSRLVEEFLGSIR
ncbi:MAG: alpha/beta hydrolase [Acidobacteriota bacterium]